MTTHCRSSPKVMPERFLWTAIDNAPQKHWRTNCIEMYSRNCLRLWSFKVDVPACSVYRAGACLVKQWSTSHGMRKNATRIATVNHWTHAEAATMSELPESSTSSQDSLRAIAENDVPKSISFATANRFSPSLPISSKGDFWDYQEQHTSSKIRPVLRYTKNFEFANWLVTTLKGDIIGMDLEWRIEGPVNVCLVQLCDENTILLIHIAAMDGTLSVDWADQ